MRVNIKELDALKCVDTQLHFKVHMVQCHL